MKNQTTKSGNGNSQPFQHHTILFYCRSRTQKDSDLFIVDCIRKKLLLVAILVDQFHKTNFLETHSIGLQWLRQYVTLL